MFSVSTIKTHGQSTKIRQSIWATWVRLSRVSTNKIYTILHIHFIFQ